MRDYNKIFREFNILTHPGSYDRETIFSHSRSLRRKISEVTVNDRTFLIKRKGEGWKKALELLPFQGEVESRCARVSTPDGRLSILLYLAHRYPRCGSKNSLTCSSLIYVN